MARDLAPRSALLRRAAPGAAPARVKTRLGGAWRVLGPHRLEAECGQASVDLVLVDPDRGVVLVLLERGAYAAPEIAVRVLRGMLRAAGFAARYPGYLPVVALALERPELAELPARIDAALAAELPLEVLDGGWAAWLATALGADAAPAEAAPAGAVELEIEIELPGERPGLRPWLRDGVAAAGALGLFAAGLLLAPALSPAPAPLPKEPEVIAAAPAAPLPPAPAPIITAAVAPPLEAIRPQEPVTVQLELAAPAPAEELPPPPLAPPPAAPVLAVAPAEDATPAPAVEQVEVAAVPARVLPPLPRTPPRVAPAPAVEQVEVAAVPARVLPPLPQTPPPRAAARRAERAEVVLPQPKPPAPRPERDLVLATHPLAQSAFAGSSAAPRDRTGGR